MRCNGRSLLIMWCMRSPSVVLCLFIPSLDLLGCPISRCVVSELLFPAVVAILLIGLRDLYTFMILS
jgi:hypothetical protein